MANYKIVFKDGRVGRSTGVAPLVTTAASADQLAERVWHYATKRLLSQHADVDLDLEMLCGKVTVGGFRTVAVFDIEEVPA
jgi:hypothetical protein